EPPVACVQSKFHRVVSVSISRRGCPIIRSRSLSTVMRKKHKNAERLRLIVDTLPYETRAAMLEGLEQYDIIAGAYSNRDGGVCPMLAAHRCGGRTDLRSFARAWDRFTGAGRARHAS